MGVLESHFGQLRQLLMAKAQQAGILNHGTSKGSARELIVSEFLRASLPREFDFDTGEIAAPDGSRSGQIDIMLIPRSAPRFELATGVSLALVHAVAAVIEIKSTLTTAPLNRPSELRNALETVESVRRLRIEPRLEPWPWTAVQQATRETVQLDHIPAVIVAFTGPSLETLVQHLHAYGANHPQSLPNVITCLDRNYTLLINDGWIHNKARLDAASQKALYLRGDHEALFDLFDLLMKVTQAWTYDRPRTPLGAYL